MSWVLRAFDLVPYPSTEVGRCLCVKVRTPRSGIIMIFNVTVADSDREAASGVTGLYVAQMIANVDHLLGRYAELLGRKQNSFRVRFGPLHITGCHKSSCGGERHCRHQRLCKSSKFIRDDAPRSASVINSLYGVYQSFVGRCTGAEDFLVPIQVGLTIGLPSRISLFDTRRLGDETTGTIGD